MLAYVGVKCEELNVKLSVTSMISQVVVWCQTLLLWCQTLFSRKRHKNSVAFYHLVAWYNTATLYPGTAVVEWESSFL